MRVLITLQGLLNVFMAIRANKTTTTTTTTQAQRLSLQSNTNLAWRVILVILAVSSSSSSTHEVLAEVHHYQVDQLQHGGAIAWPTASHAPGAPDMHQRDHGRHDQDPRTIRKLNSIQLTEKPNRSLSHSSTTSSNSSNSNNGSNSSSSSSSSNTTTTTNNNNNNTINNMLENEDHRTTLGNRQLSSANTPSSIIPENKERNTYLYSLPACRVLITNSFMFHWEVLESMMHVPLEWLKLVYTNASNHNQAICNPHWRIYDYAITQAKHDSSWERYFTSIMKRKYRHAVHNDASQHDDHGCGSSGDSHGDNSKGIIAGNIMLFHPNAKNRVWSAEPGKLIHVPSSTSSGDKELTPPQLPHPKQLYSVILETSCYCPTKMYTPLNFIEWVHEYPSHRRCMLHRICPETFNDTNFLSSSPYNPRFFLPSILPTFENASLVQTSSSEKTRLTDCDNNDEIGCRKAPPYTICTIGATTRRDYGFLEHFFVTRLNRRENVVLKWIERVMIFGAGKIPAGLRTIGRESSANDRDSDGVMDFLLPPIEQYDHITDFVQFQYEISSKCDILLSLLSKKTHKQYFEKTLSGTIAQAFAYDIPLVLHEVLISVYGGLQALPTMYEGHDDSAESFALALSRLLERLNMLSGNGSESMIH